MLASSALVLALRAVQPAHPAAPGDQAARLPTGATLPGQEVHFASATVRPPSADTEPASTALHAAPGAWRTLTLIGTTRYGARFWLLGTQRAGVAGGPAYAADRTALTEVGLAIAFEFHARWPRLFLGVIAASAAAGQPRGQRVGVTASAGLVWTIPELFVRPQGRRRYAP